jgi:tRNA-Thr(GGU) m(6)t(6)A37 methyltransferase TsaA
MKYNPIGIIHTPYKTREVTPHHTYESDAIGEVEVYPKFEPGLTGIELYSHIILIYEFHKANRTQLLVVPHHDNKLYGVFATRSPDRPNPIGISVVKLLARERNILKVQHLDILDGTPLLDIKPYLSNELRESSISEEHMKNNTLCKFSTRSHCKYNCD